MRELTDDEADAIRAGAISLAQDANLLRSLAESCRTSFRGEEGDEYSDSANRAQRASETLFALVKNAKGG